MERMDENTKVIRNQVPQTPPPGTPGGAPRPVRPAPTAKGNNDNRAIMAAAAVLLGGTLGVGGAMAANAYNEEMDDLSATAENNARIADELKEQVEDLQSDLDDAKADLQAEAAAPRKVVVIDDDMPDGVRVHSYTHITGSDGSEMDVAYVTRNGVRGYYVDADHDGVADGFIPENATSQDDIINLREYGETVYMDPMADRVGISYMTYDGSLYGGADNDVAVVDNPFEGVTTGEVDPDIEGPDYTNNANVEGMTGNVNDDNGFLDDDDPGFDDPDGGMEFADSNVNVDEEFTEDDGFITGDEEFNDFEDDGGDFADNDADTYPEDTYPDEPYVEEGTLDAGDESFMVDNTTDTGFDDAPVIDDQII